MSQVLALKYRPKRFEDLIGQGTISQTLSLALDSNRLSHAYLFSGLRGSGKTSTARIMSKALLCSNGPTSKPCEVCDNCVAANEGKHIDIIEMDAASNRGIDDIKELIEHTKYKPSSAKYKVFIIDEVHMLTPQAFNALLKTLEEPPAFVKFILATTDPLKLPATILSRTQHFRFKKISQKDVINHLSHILRVENIEFEKEALEVLSRSGQGSLRDTLTMLDQAIIFAKGKLSVSAVTDMLGLIDPAFMNNMFDLILNRGDINNILHELEDYEAGLVIDEMTIYLRNKMLENDARFDILMYDRFFRILADAKQLLFLNSDSSFVLILTFSKMVEATNLRTINEIINEVEKVEPKPEPIKSTEPIVVAQPEVKKEEPILQTPTPTAPVQSEPAPAQVTTPIPEPVIEQSPEPSIPLQAEPVAIQSATTTPQPTVEQTPIEQNIAEPMVNEPIITQKIEQEPIAQNTITNEPIVQTPMEQTTPVQAVTPVQNIPEPSPAMEQAPAQNIVEVNPVNQQTQTIAEPVVQNQMVNTIAPASIPSQNIQEQVSPIQDNPAPIISEPVIQTPPISHEQNTQIAPEVQNMIEPMVEQNVIQNEPIASIPLNEPIVEPIAQTPPPMETNPTPVVSSVHMDKFNTVIKNIYERNYDLANCFEKNFFFEKIEGDLLYIRSVAEGECKKLLWKEFSHIRIFIEEVFGENTQIEFIKDLPQPENVTNLNTPTKQIEPPKKEENKNQSGSMIEDIELGNGGCVADMHNTKNDKNVPSQREEQVEEILNGPMITRIKELFDPKKIVIKSKV